MYDVILNPYLKFIQKISGKRNVEVFLVGGFLRDSLLGRESFDLDFAVERNAISLAKRFAKDIKGAFILLDQEHGCARVAKKHKGKVWTFDFADYRAKTLRGDLAHRDFTINTLVLSLNSWAGADVTKGIRINRQAKQDLKDKTIRMVSRKAFQQDPLRLLRAFASRAQLGFSIEKETLAQIKKEAHLIRSVSAERIREEIFKIFESPRASSVLKKMDRIGLLEYVIPQVRVMFGVQQGTYHHLDVWRHSLESVKQLEFLIKEFSQDDIMAAYLNEEIAGNRSRKALLKLGCLLHDVGKPETRRREGDRIRFHGHEHVGKKITYAVARQLKLSTRERHVLCDMVQLHLRPGYLSNFKRPSAKAVFRYFRDTKQEAVSIALLAMADQRATRGPMTLEKDAVHHDEVCRILIRQFFEKQAEEPFVPLLNGHDLIHILKLQPSPFFSKILKGVEESQATGKISTKEEALSLARQLSDKIRGERDTAGR